MPDIFQLFCPSCGSRLNAKADLIGQTRNCPKCKTPIVIQPQEQPALAVSEPGIIDRVVGLTLEAGYLAVKDLPKFLQNGYRYLILNADRIVAVWETGKGWQVNVGSGYAPAKKNINAIPDQGTFTLVEIVVAPFDGNSIHAGSPQELHLFKISQRGALTALYRDESEILEKVSGNATLTSVQKSLMMNYLRQNFMYESLVHSQPLLNSLAMS